MKLREQRTLCFSVAVHVVGLFSFAVVGLLANCTEETEQVHVFELVTPQPVAQLLTPSVPVSLQATPPLESPQQISSPTPPPSTAQNEPIVSNSKAQVVTAEPKQVMSYGTYAAKHMIAIPKSVQAPSAKPRQIRIDPNEYTLPPIPRNQPTTLDNFAIDRYREKVANRLKVAWERLLVQTNLTLGGQTQVQFGISSTGVVLSVVIEHSSGNRLIDNLAVDVFRAVGNLGAPPPGFPASPLHQLFRVN